MLRKYRFLLIVLFVLILSIGCKDIKEDQDGDIDKGSQEQEDVNKGGDESEDEGKVRSDKVMDEFLDIYRAEKNADDLGIYIRENIKDVEEDDGEEMIRLLLESQTEIMEDFIEKIFKAEYLRALNEDMGGILDKNKLENIANENVRKDYKKLVDGFMTIVRYEETPVVETDWKELNKLSPYLAEDFGQMIGLYQKIQNYEYNREELDVESIGQDIIRTETILKKEHSDFVNIKAKELYELQIYSLLVGPEGNYLDFFLNKNSWEYKDILALKDDYPESSLSQIIEELDKGNYQEEMEVLELIQNRLEI